MVLTKGLCDAGARAAGYLQHGAIVTGGRRQLHWAGRQISNTSKLRFASGTPRCPLPNGGRCNSTATVANALTRDVSQDSPPQAVSKFSLPLSCPGCGALSQEIHADRAGYYSRNRKAVKAYAKAKNHHSTIKESAVLIEENHNVSQEKGMQEMGRDAQPAAQLQDSTVMTETVQTPICDRCHDLIYNSKGQSIAHPSIEDIADSIAESPFKRNHVYHVLDAADFPMSLFPKVFENLELAKPRGQNRRARHKFTTKPTLSFIITRSDLLAPAKEMVDKMLPYFQSVLRKALGRAGRDVRLGNVHLVSAKRGWWTTEIKENIWERGGGNWMVGRVNVGKSNLFEVLFPKGSRDQAPVYAELKQEQDEAKTSLQSYYQHFREGPSDGHEQAFLLEDSLLPPAQPEVPFPTMPIVSNLPGTTASPIRLPFGNHKGELIDLPGLGRGNLEEFVKSEHKTDLVMQYRPNVQQLIIRPGQSLILGGGLVRITPLLDEDDPSTTMLAYPFVPIEAHVTATDKAIGAQLQERESGIKSILAEGVGKKIASTGIFNLSTDVTKARAGPLFRAGVSASRLPFVVYSTDILIEGLGWVELVCQVRKPRRSSLSAEQANFNHADTLSITAQSMAGPGLNSAFKPFATETSKGITGAGVGSTPHLPRVEIFSPHGKHVSHRQPLGAWQVWDSGRKRRARASTASRQRKPMAGAKKQAKLTANAAESRVFNANALNDARL